MPSWKWVPFWEWPQWIVTAPKWCLLPAWCHMEIMFKKESWLICSSASLSSREVMCCHPEAGTFLEQSTSIVITPQRVPEWLNYSWEWGGGKVWDPVGWETGPEPAETQQGGKLTQDLWEPNGVGSRVQDVRGPGRLCVSWGSIIVWAWAHTRIPSASSIP